MRQGRTTFMKLDAGARDDSRSRMDMNRSTKGSRGRLSARPSRLLCRLIGAAGLACLAAAPGCSEEFDTSRQLPPRGTVGEEVYGVLCDRVAAQALREDLTGASFRDICHKPRNGDYANEVDASKLLYVLPVSKNKTVLPLPRIVLRVLRAFVVQQTGRRA